MLATAAEGLRVGKISGAVGTFAHIGPDAEEREWLFQVVESRRFLPPNDPIDRRALLYLDDHRTRGESVLPPAAYVEMALEVEQIIREAVTVLYRVHARP